MAIIIANASNFLYLQQTITVSWTLANASNQLTFIQSITCNIKQANVSQKLIFNQQAIDAGNIYIRSVSQILGFSQITFPRVWESDIYQIFHVWQTIDYGIVLNNNLLFNQSVTVDVSKGTYNELSFNQNLSYNGYWSRNIAQTLTFNQNVSVYKSIVAGQLNRGCLYVPMDGRIYSGIILTYQTYTLNLPAPDFDNSDRLAFDRINRHTRGGDLEVMRDSGWPKTRTFIYRWSFLDHQQAEQARQFCRQTLGQLINITDYEGNTFTGFVRTPTSEESQPQRKFYAFSMELELV